MRPIAGIYARPLLFAGRAQIIDYAAKHHLKWRDDHTNNEIKYLRNHIRHELLPALNQIDDQFLDKISESTNILAGEESLLHYLQDQALESMVSRTNSLIRIAKNKLTKFPQQQVLLYRFLKTFDFNMVQVQDIVSCTQFGKQFFSPNFVLLVERDFLEILPKSALTQKPSEWFIAEDQQRMDIPLAMEIKKLQRDTNFKLEKRTDLALLDFDRLLFPLKIRKWQEGDRFKPLGMKGSKLLSDFFIDNKFSEMEKRQSFLLLNANNQIVWLIGHRIDDNFKIKPQTKVVYRIDLQ
jgi:tRNA(Ile)-lysidine synthase